MDLEKHLSPILFITFMDCSDVDSAPVCRDEEGVKPKGKDLDLPVDLLS